MLNQGQLQCQAVPLVMASPSMGFEEIFPRGTGNRVFLKKKKEEKTGTVIDELEVSLWQ